MIKNIIDWYRGLPSKCRWIFPILFLILTAGGPILGFCDVSPVIQAFISILGFTFFMVEIVLESFMIVESKLEEKTKGQINRINILAENIVRIIEGTKYKEREPDIIKRILEMKLGEEVTHLFKFDNLPVTLVPGGDIAIIMTQEDYKTLLENLLQKPWQNLRWTTFTPFEALNQGLSIKTSIDREKWEHRIDRKNEYLEYNFSGNENMFKYISSWYKSSGQKQQLIILSQEPSHPLYYEKYIKYPFCIDISKYLVARYGVIKEKNIKVIKESEFINKIAEALLKDKQDNEFTKWIYIEDINVTHLSNIHHLDFVMFQGNNRFVLVRVDPANYMKGDGGLVGVTFLVYVERNVQSYENLFEKMSEKGKNSFCSLIGNESNGEKVAEAMRNSTINQQR